MLGWKRLSELEQEQVGPSVLLTRTSPLRFRWLRQAKRAKNYQIKVHFLNEQQQRGSFYYEKVGTKEQMADTFTKALPRDDFCRYRDVMGVKFPPSSEEGAESVGA